MCLFGKRLIALAILGLPDASSTVVPKSRKVMMAYIKVNTMSEIGEKASEDKQSKSSTKQNNLNLLRESWY